MIETLIDKLTHRKTKVYFVYAEEHKTSGSTVMRGFQLADMASKGLKSGHKVKVAPYTQRMRNAIIIFTKGATYSIPVGRLQELRTDNNRLVFDPVDGKIDSEKLQYADAIIAASKIAHDKYPATYPGKKIFLVYHHADPRIKAKSMATGVGPRIGYFGEPENTIITERLRKHVDFIRTDTRSQSDLQWLNEIPYYNLHYAVRKVREFDDVKPATKVFNAAYCNANVIVQDSEQEAVKWLGEDYPYLIRGDVTEAKILDILSFAKSSYGNEEWKRGLATMAKIREQISETSIGSQVFDLISWLSRQPEKL